MKISVALCTYNGENFLREQINSIINQSVSVNEIVVCDDCSSDTTPTILEEYNQKYPQLFKIFINEINLRSSKNFEKAISLTTGDYIFLADQDDIWRNDKVEKTIEVFSKNSSAEGVFSNANFINEDSKPIFNEISLWESVCFFHESIKQPSDLRKSLIQISNFLTGATLCIKKEVKKFGIPFLITESFIHDEWLAYILTQRNTLFFSTENLISYRLHENQQLGVRKIKNPKKRLIKNKRLNSLLLDNIKFKTFKELKYIAKVNNYQLEKYRSLHFQYKKNEFLEVKEKLITRYLEIDSKMKRANPIFYFLEKILRKK